MAYPEVAELVKKVHSNVVTWPKVPDTEKVAMLKRMIETLDSLVDEWANKCNESRHYANHPHLHGAGALTGPAMCGLHLNALLQTYESIVKNGKPPHGNVRTVGDQHIVQTYPFDTLDKAFYPGTIELWLEPGKKPTQGACRGNTGLAAILGPGNYETPNDILSTMFCESKVVVYSPHPNLAKSNVPFYRRIFKELIDAGYLGIIEPDPDPAVVRAKAAALLKTPEICAMVMTGGCKTYDNIVWGAEGKKTGKKAFDKPVGAELGACSPWIIAPGPWTDKELEHHAGVLAGNKLINTSAVCASPQLLMLQKDWPHREVFMKKLEAKLRSVSKSGSYPVFYPGTEQRVQAAKDAYPAEKVREISLGADGAPCALLRLDESDAGSHVCKEESFAPVLAEIPIDAASTKDFLEKAQKLANSEKVFGSLSCSVIISDASSKELGADFIDKWLQRQEWGATAVNDWAGFAAVMPTAIWGGYPGKHSPEDIQSGQGWVGNYRMYDNVQKAVVRSPFINPVHPKGPATVDDAAVGGRMARFTVKPSFSRLAPLLLTALGGRNAVAIAKAMLVLFIAFLVACRRR